MFNHVKLVCFGRKREGDSIEKTARCLSSHKSRRAPSSPTNSERVVPIDASSGFNVESHRPGDSPPPLTFLTRPNIPADVEASTDRLDKSTESSMVIFRARQLESIRDFPR